MPSWKDSLTGPEIDALHKYKTQGKDSLSGDEIDIVYKYKDYLKPQQTKESSGVSIVDDFLKPAAQRLTGAAGSLLDFVAPIGSAVHGYQLLDAATRDAILGGNKTQDVINKGAPAINPTQLLERAGIGKEWLSDTETARATNTAMEKLNDVVQKNISDPAFEATNSPLLGAIGQTVGTLAPFALGAKVLPKAPTTPKGFTGFKGRPESSLADRVAKAEQEASTTKGTTVEQTSTGYPEIKDAPPIIPDSWKEGLEQRVTEQPLPVLPDQLKPLSEQYSVETPIGAVEGGTHSIKTPFPELPPIDRGLLSLEGERNTPIPDTQRLATRHDVPTIDFPLRQEVLESPEIKGAIDSFRSEAERLQTIVDNAINPKNREKAATELKALQEEFGAGMRQLGIDIPQEAIGLQKLYQGGEGTKLPVEQTFNAGRFNKKQKGAVNFGFSEAVVDGIKKLADHLTPEELSKVVKGIRASKVEEELQFYSNKLEELKKAEPKSTNPFVTHARESSIKNTENVVKILQDINNSSYLGQTSIGKSQRGSIGFQKKAPTLEQYKKNIEQELGREVTDEVASKLYTEDYPHLTATNKAKQAIAKVPGLEQFNKYESRPVLDDPLGTKSVERMEQVGDKDVQVNFTALGKNALSAGRIQGWRSKSPVVYEGIGFITSVKDTYRIKAAEYLSNFSASLQKFELPNGLKDFFSSSEWKQAFDVFKVRRENEFNPNFKPESVLNKKQVELFNTMQDITTRIGDAVEQRLQELGNKVDFKRLPFYLSSYFIGDYTVPVFNRHTGQFIFNLREITKDNAFKAEEWLKQHPDYKPGKVDVTNTTAGTNRTLSQDRLVNNFEHLIDLLGRNDPETIKALNIMSGRQEGFSMGTSGMPNRFKEKSGMFGSLGDKPWLSEKQNYLDAKKAFEMYVTGANEWLANTQVSSFLKNMNSSEKITATGAKSLINDYGNYVVGLKDSNLSAFKDAMAVVEHSLGRSRGDAAKLARQYSSAVTAQLVGWWSPRAMVQNLFQPAQAAIPMLQKLKYVEGYQGDILSSIAKGTFEGIADIVDHWKDSDYVSVSRGFKESNHVIDAHLVDQIRTFGGSHRAGIVYNSLANKSVSFAEQFARSVTFSIVHNFLESTGFSREVALDMAKNITHEIMVNYEDYAKPQMFGRTGLPGELAGKLQTYKMNDLTQTVGYIEDMSRNPKTWVPVSTKLMMSVMFAGLTGIIGFDIASLLWEAAQQANQKVEEPNEYLATHTLKDFIYESMPVAVSKGALSAVTGYDFSGAFAQNLVGDSPAHSIVPIAGKVPEHVAAIPNIVSGITKNSNMDLAKGLQAITPSSLSHLPEKLVTEDRDGEKVVYSPNTGEVTYSGTTQGTFSNIKTLDRSRQSAERQSLFKAQSNIKEAEKEVEKGTMSAVTDWMLAKDTDTAEKAMQRVTDNLDRYLKVGGDPDMLWSKVEQKLVRIGIADDVLNQLRQEVTLSNRFMYNRALELQQQRTK